jgi:uncharacterized membrane protein YdjX (TVP38/TMEM64 family)
MPKTKKHPAKRKLSTKQIFAITASVLAVAAIVVLCILFGDKIFALFSKTDEIKNFIRDAGALGPIVYILLQIAQVVVAPIPGQVVGIVGGYLFGWWGFLLSMIGGCLGYYIIFKIARRFGRPLVERIFKKEQIKKFDYVTESKGPFLLFLIFVLPLFPDDMICYLAGLTKAPIKSLMLAAVAGRIPGFLISNLAGMGLGANNMSILVFTIIGTLAIFAVAYWQRDWLQRFAKSHDHKKFLKENWKLSAVQTMAALAAIVLFFVLACLFAFSDF